MKSKPSPVAGILLLDKPAEITSAGVVARVKHVLGGIKVGHLGTLDPFATGLLPLCVGEGTKIAPYLNLAAKEYSGVIRLGLVTDTLDVTGTVVREEAAPEATAIDLEALEKAFCGEIQQVPPEFSAIKQGGVRMYQLAREGRAPRLDPRPVCIHRLVLTALEGARLKIEVACSKGTYIRSLARDIGERVGCGATLESLRRTAFGRFRLAEALPLPAADEAAEARPRLIEAVLPLASALSELRALTVDRATAEHLRRGRQEALARIAGPRVEGETARVLDCRDALVAVVSERRGRWRLDRVFAPAAPCAP